MKFDCVQKGLEKLFYKYGKLIGRKPLPFLLTPILITLLSTTGFARFSFIQDSEYLYTPKNGEAKIERSFFVDEFPEDQDKYFSAERKNTVSGILIVLITKSENGGNVLTEDVIQFAKDIDAEIKNRSITYNGQVLNYNSLCAKWDTSCLPNTFLELLDYNPENVTMLNITYPFYNSIFLGRTLGDVTVNSNGKPTNAEGLFMSYFTKCIDQEDIEMGNIWFSEVKNYLLEYKDTGKVYFYTPLSFDEELESSYIALIPKFVISFVILLLFCIVSCMTSDWVNSKPWVALAGEASAFMSIITAVGLLLAFGLELFVGVGVTPFIILGIGVDDMFVMISSWRLTKPSESVEERMGQMMSTAAVSITITSLTDTLAFAFGSISPFPSIVRFSSFTTVAIIFSYFYAITFLAACMAYSGRQEAEGLHVITFLKAVPKSEAGDRSRLFRWFCTGGIQLDKENLSEKKESFVEMTFIARFFKDKYTPFILKVPVKIVVLCVYVIYLGIAIWGCTFLTEGLQLKELVPPDSYLRHYLTRFESSFADNYGPQIMFALSETIDYSDSDIRNDVLATVENIKNLDYFLTSPEMVVSWLTEFTTYLSDTGQNPRNMSHFISLLNSEFLAQPQNQIYELDININSQETEITSSRFLFQTFGVSSTLDEKSLMVNVREFAENSMYDMVVYHSSFIINDQYTVIVSSTIQTIGIAVASAFVVSLVLLSNMIAVFWVTISVVSIFTGVIGYLVLWGGTLNYFTAIFLSMCIGFAVDFCAHICYHYVHSSETIAALKVAECLAYLGQPILQGTLSTVLAVVVLASSQEYIFFTFFTVVFLVMVFGFIHGVVFIPVLLSTITDVENHIKYCKSKKKEDQGKVSQKSMQNESINTKTVKEAWKI